MILLGDSDISLTKLGEFWQLANSAILKDSKGKRNELLRPANKEDCELWPHSLHLTHIASFIPNETTATNKYMEKERTFNSEIDKNNMPFLSHFYYDTKSVDGVRNSLNHGN